MSRLFALLLVLALAAMGCASANDNAQAIVPAPDTATGASFGAATPTGVPTLATQATAIVEALPTGEPAATDAQRWTTGTSEYIFNQNALHTFELTLPPAALAQIDADPTAEEYVEGSLTFEGETIAEVGIRYKGSVGAFVGCVDGSAPLNPSGAKTCTKLSMKIKINWTDSDTTFFGLKKLQFHSQNLDQSHLRERLGYWLFGEMGVPTPRSVHARLIINGEFFGLFALTEQIDGRFARENFEDGTGNLYKEVWPVDMYGEPLAASEYLDALVTNEDEDPSAAIIATFGETLSAAADTSELQDAITSNTDLSELLSYIAVDRTIRHDDGPFHWYCFGDGYGQSPCSNHNFYLYEDPTDATMHLIPWDLDNAFENIGSDRNPVTPIADAFGETSGDCKPFSYGAIGLSQFSASCEPFSRGLATFDTAYEAKLVELVEGPLAEDVVNKMIDTWSAQIEAAVIEADDLHTDAVTEAAWRRSVDQLRDSLSTAREQAVSAG